MDETTITSAPSAGAETVSAGSTGSSSPAPSSPADVYLQMAQDATREPAQPNTPDTGTPAVAAGEVPAEGAQTPEAKPEETEPAAVTPEAEEQALRQAFENGLPEDVKQVFKDKPWLRTAYYQARGMREAGWSLTGIRTAAKAGLTESTFGELNSLFPTMEDARRTAGLAASMQALRNDFVNNPDAFVQSMFETDPNAAKAIAQRIAGRLPQADPDTYVNTVATGLQNLFRSMESKADSILRTEPDSVRAQDLKIAIDMIRKEIFPESGQPQAQRPQIDPAIERELTELRGKEQAYRQAQEQAYQQEIYNSSVNGLTQFVDGLFKEANPTGFSDKGLARIKAEAIQAIGDDFMRNPIIKADLDRMVASHAPIPQVMEFVSSRLIPLANRVVAEKLREYTQDFFVRSQTTNPQPVPAAPPRDVGAVGGTVRPVDSRGEPKFVPGVPYEEQMARWLTR